MVTLLGVKIMPRQPLTYIQPEITISSQIRVFLAVMIKDFTNLIPNPILIQFMRQ